MLKKIQDLYLNLLIRQLFDLTLTILLLEIILKVENCTKVYIN